MGWVEFFAITFLGGVVGALVTILFRRYRVGHPDDDNLAGIKLTGLYTLFAVILGFVILSSWQFYAESTDSVRTEAASASVVNRNAASLPGKLGQPVQSALERYLGLTVATEWPHVDRTPATERPASVALETVNREIVKLPSQNSVPVANSQNTMLYYLGQLETARAERVFFAEDDDPDFVWAFLFVGGMAVMILSATLHFRSARLHILMVASMSAIFAASLFSIYALNHPFSGPFPVSSDSLELVQQSVHAHLD